MPIEQNDDFWVTRLDKIEAKQDKIIDSQTALLLKVSLNTQVLTEHQRRSLANEQLVILTKQEADARMDALRAEIKPLLQVHTATTVFAKATLYLGGLAALAYTAMKIFGFAH